MKKSLKVFFLFIFFGLVQSGNAQGFDAALLLGLNAAQVNGDGLVGYHKVGLEGGLRVSYPLRTKTDLGLELLFSQRGSRSAYNIPGDLVNYTTLNYLAVPFFINYKDWYIEEEDYYKVRAEGGFSYGYLFDVTSNNVVLEDEIGNFKRNDLSIHVGVSYAVNKKWNFSARWTRGLLYLLKSPNLPNVEAAISYYLNFRVEYNL